MSSFSITGRTSISAAAFSFGLPPHLWAAAFAFGLPHRTWAQSSLSASGQCECDLCVISADRPTIRKYYASLYELFSWIADNSEVRLDQGATIAQINRRSLRLDLTQKSASNLRSRMSMKQILTQNLRSPISDESDSASRAQEEEATDAAVS